MNLGDSGNAEGISSRSMTHGDHWAAIHPEVEDLSAAIVHLLEQGSLSPTQPDPGYVPGGNGSVYRYFLGPDAPLNGMAILKSGATREELVMAYPSLTDLASNELEIFTADPDEDAVLPGLEGYVTAITREGTEVKFFCPAWLAFRSALEAGGRYEFGLGALAYSIEPAPREIEVTEGGLFEKEKQRRSAEDPAFNPSTFTSMLIGVGDLRAYLPRDHGDFEYQSVVEEVTPFRALGTAGLMLTLNLAPEDSQRLTVRIYACDAVLGGWRPAVGDPVRGVAWLQGMPQRKVDAADSWLDSAEAAHGAGGSRFLAMASFVYDHPHLPLAFQLVGASLVGSGWEITSIEQKRFRTWAPAFHVRRRHEDFWIFIRTAIKGFCEAPPFGLDRAQTDEYAATYRARCLWITITLEPSGSKTYAVKTEGLQEFDAELAVPPEALRPEEFNIMASEQPHGGASQPVLEEAQAASIFAEAITQGDLAAFSAVLVEDLEYVSHTAGVRIRGRHAFLCYLGTHLDQWIKDEKPITASAGRLPSSRDSRPCTLACDADGQLIAVSVFTGRKGHISMIETFSPKVLEE
jgi:hypothetical protein